MPNQASTLRDLSDCVVDDGRLYLLRVVGSGAYGRLYKARDPNPPAFTTYAVKCLRRPAPGSREAEFQERERALHRRVSDHPNVVTLYRHFHDADHLFLVMDFCRGGDMYQALLRGVYRGNTERIKRTWAELADGVRWCHNRGVYHRDIKPENVLVDFEGGAPLIADFGLSTTSRVSHDMDCGSASYMSPGTSHCPPSRLPNSEPRTESFSSASVAYSPQHSDNWALTIILINLVTEMNPWTSAEPTNDVRYTAFASSAAAAPRILLALLPLAPALAAVLARSLAPAPARRAPLAFLAEDVATLRALFPTPADRAAAAAEYASSSLSEPGSEPALRGYMSDGTLSTSGSGYSSLASHAGRAVHPVAVALALPRALPAPAAPALSALPALSLTFAPFGFGAGFGSGSGAGAPPSSGEESAGPATPAARGTRLPCVPGAGVLEVELDVAVCTSQRSSGAGAPHAAPAHGGKFTRFMRRLRGWRKLGSSRKAKNVRERGKLNEDTTGMGCVL
ncbi:kinase-like domain-containing protein [Mycena belliarum]|uniref:Kinase-like domain-containing protein n=1 Tax=Mycena belliarum TaxID=1033014 RepID=A0AAD6XN29_9AGAR|nr:kinase-like domain-containing protein [Mycena belliae]